MDSIETLEKKIEALETEFLSLQESEIILLRVVNMLVDKVETLEKSEVK
jgi:hypothetical protein